MNNKLIVLYVDDNPNDLENYEEFWRELLHFRGFTEVDFRTSTKFDIATVDNILPHLIIADNVLVSSDGTEELDNEGAQFIADLKTKYAHIVCILFTHATFSIKTLGQLTPNPDLLIPKNHFRSPEYRNDWVGPKFESLLTRRPIGSLSFDPPSQMHEYKDAVPTITCLLEQCLNDVLSYEADIAAQIKLSKLTGGLSGASVFLMHISGIDRFHNVPLVFRMSKSKYISEEIRNYKRFVSLQVPHDLRVELLGFGEHLNFGGALYAFALADVAHTTTALSLLKERKDDRNAKLAEIVNKVLKREGLGWYKGENFGNANLVQYFSNQEEYNQKKDHRRIRGIVRNLTKFSIDGYTIDGDNISTKDNRLQLPRNIMDKLSDIEIPFSVGHGDLNLNNIIVSENHNRVALIDFEYCGVDHIFKDLISLEVSTLSLIDGFQNVENAIDFFRDRHSCTTFWERGDDLVGVIREACTALHEIENGKSEVGYLLCLSFHLFKVAALDGLDKEHFVAMFGSLCVALEKLNGVVEGPPTH